MKTNTPTRRRPATRSKKRSFPKRFLLHPAVFLGVLCAGVLLAVASFGVKADSYDITATVPAPPLNAPAIITSPYDRQHVAAPLITVTGSCPASSYVKVFRDTALSGIAQCSEATFSVQTSLLSQTNHLSAKVYNFTDNEGPVSPPVTVYYDAITIAAQELTETPRTLSIASLDTASYKSDVMQSTGTRPTVSGWAPPYSLLTLTFHSDVFTCLTTADDSGWWTCTPDKALSPGQHTIIITATTTDGKTITLSPITLFVAAGLPSMLRTLPATNLAILYDYHYQTHRQAEPWTWDLKITGGTPPYHLSAAWRDGTTTDTQTTPSFTLQHTFSVAETYRPFIKITDYEGAIATLQLSAIVQPAQAASHSIGTVANDIRQYLWIIWPAYLVILLMITSFWLGEYEIIRRLHPAARRRTLRK